MARYVTEEQLQEDRETLRALKNLKGFIAVNPSHKLEHLLAADAELSQLQDNEQQAKSAHQSVRTALQSAARDFHNDIVGVRMQVAAQFGRDSQEVQDVGYKKLSNRKRLVRRAKGDVEESA